MQKSFLSKDPDAMQPHIRAFVERAVTFTVCPGCDGTRLSEAARSSKIGGFNIADACAMQISDLAAWVRGLDEPSVAPLLEALLQTLDSFVEIRLGYLWLDRPSGTRRTPTGSPTSAPAPATTAAGSSSRAHPPTSSPPAPPSPASTSRPTSAETRSARYEKRGPGPKTG